VFFLTLAAVSGIGFSFLLAHFLEIPLSYAYFVGVNLTIFLAYGFDKYQAIRSHSRILEIVCINWHYGHLVGTHNLLTHNPKTLLQNHLHSDCMGSVCNHFKHATVTPGPRF
jgi:hypothetical protein